MFYCMESEEIKTLLIEVVNLLRRIAGPAPAVPVVEVPPPRVEVSLTDISEGLDRVLEKLDEIGEALGVPPYHTDYMTEKGITGKGSVSSGSPVDEDIVDILGRKARYGYIYSETGTITVQLNNGAEIPLKVSDSLNLVDLHLEVERLQITTTSATALTYRLLFV